MLNTNLEHIETQQEFDDLLKNNENVMVCCGRMGPMCVPVYAIMEDIRDEYPHVKMVDMDFDIPVAINIRNLPECASFMGLPFTVYFKNGKVVEATTSVQSKEAVTATLNRAFGQKA